MSKSKEIRVDVIGGAGTGKSAVIALIHKALEEAGLSSKVFAVDVDHDQYMTDVLKRVDRMVDDDTLVKIHEVQTARDW